MEGYFPFKDGVCLHCHGPETSLLFRPGHCLSHSLTPLNPARLLYVGRWSFDLISSEILPFLLITNCFTVNPQQHKISPQFTVKTSIVSQHLSPSTSHLLLLPSYSLSSLSQFSSLSSSNFQSSLCLSTICVCTTERKTEGEKH